MVPHDPHHLLVFGTYAALVCGVVVIMVGASYVLGQRHNDRATSEPYESGIVSEGSARLRLTSQFFLVAMLFVIFDLEAVFVFAWAVVVQEVGWTGYAAITVFIAMLLLALAYLWRIGAISWGPVTRPDSTLPKTAEADGG